MNTDPKKPNPCCVEHAARLKRLAQARDALERAVSGMKLQVQSMEAALEASRARRNELLFTLGMFVAAEDGRNLTDAEYDHLMDGALKRGRSQLALERRLEQQQKGGAR